MKKSNLTGKKYDMRRKRSGAGEYLLFTRSLLNRYRNRPGYGGFLKLFYLVAGDPKGSLSKGPGDVYRYTTKFYKNIYLKQGGPGQSRMISGAGDDGVYRAFPAERREASLLYGRAGIHERILKITETLYERAGEVSQGNPVHRGEETTAPDSDGAHPEKPKKSTVLDMLRQGEMEEIGSYARKPVRPVHKIGQRSFLRHGAASKKYDINAPAFGAGFNKNEHVHFSEDLSYLRDEKMRGRRLLHREPAGMVETAGATGELETPESSEKGTMVEAGELKKSAVAAVGEKTVEEKNEMIFEAIIRDERKMKKFGNYFFDMFEEKIAREFERRGIS